jgi:hypothetical protein
MVHLFAGWYSPHVTEFTARKIRLTANVYAAIASDRNLIIELAFQ